jgi:ASC-1-like (ASCH) protein
MSNGAKLNVDYKKHPDTGMGLGFSGPLYELLFRSKKEFPVSCRDFILVIDKYVEQSISSGCDCASVLSEVTTYLKMSKREFHRRLWEARLEKDGRKSSNEPRNYELTLYPEYFDAIRNGIKTIEGRAYSDEISYHTWMPGDIINFTRLSNPTNGIRTDEKISVRIDAVNHYETVREMLENEEWEKMQPNATSLKDAIGKYYGIDESYEDRIQEEGIFAIKIELLPQKT